MDDVEAWAWNFVRKIAKGDWRPYGMALFRLCASIAPDIVLDIGTGPGLSCLCLALGLRRLGKPLSSLTTVDFRPSGWRTLADAALLRRYGMDLFEINALTCDFKSLDPADFFSDGDRVLLFYDIHDCLLPEQREPNSPALLEKWVPRIQEGMVALHDFTPCESGYNLPAEDRSVSYSKATHWAGQTFYGFAECAPVIAWLNRRRIPLAAVPETSIVYFEVGRNGD